MTKPTTDKGSKSSANSKTNKSKEPLKLKKDAAEPGSIATRDVGPGKGDSAAAKGVVVSPVDSTLVGQDDSGRAAAQPKAKPDMPGTDKAVADKPTTAVGADATKVAGKAAGRGSDMPMTADDTTGKVSGHSGKPSDSSGGTPEKAGDRPKDSSVQEGKSSLPPVDARKSVSEPAKPASASVTPPATTTVRKTGFWPIVFGGIVAAGLGAGATIWALPHLPAGWLPEESDSVDAEAIRNDAVAAATKAAEDVAQAAATKLVEEAIANAPAAEAAALPEGLEAKIDDHSQRLAALEDAAAASAAEPEPEPESGNASLVPAQPPAGTADAPAPASGDLAALKSQLEEQAAKIAELEARPRLDPEAISSVQALAENAGSLQQKISGIAEEAEAKLAAAQKETARLQQEAAESTQRAQAIAAVAALQSALDKGVTAEQTQKAFANAGMDAPKALQQDIPSLDKLQSGFGEAARAALRAEMSDPASDASGGNMLTNFLKAQTGYRSVEPREGDDADAVLSRAEAMVEAGDIAAALTEMEPLPQSALQTPIMAEWLAGAQAYRDAQAALTDLSAPKN